MSLAGIEESRTPILSGAIALAALSALAGAVGHACRARPSCEG